MGSAVRFIPRPVVVGFTNGIAVLIASTQIRDFFGLQTGALPGEFLPRLEVLASHLGTWSPVATALAALTLVIVIVASRVSKRIPGAVIALLAGTVAVAVFGLHVETIGTQFGGIPAGLPRLHWPEVHWASIGGLLVPAMTVAMLGGRREADSQPAPRRRAGPAPRIGARRPEARARTPVSIDLRREAPSCVC